MKKALFTVLLLCSALSASAQAKYSIRVGVGTSSNRWGNSDGAVMLNFNSNIRLARGSHWIFSPGATFEFNFDDGPKGYVPLQFGYTSRISSKIYFLPKVGFSTGYYRDFIMGPNFELGFEMKHFTFGLDGFISLLQDYNPMAFHLNFGYVF